MVAGESFLNGQVLTQSLTTRQLPNQIKVVKSGGPTAMDLTYGYDARRLITSVTDAVTSANTRGYTYDVNSRVLTASGPWSGGSTGSYSYDALDNLRQTVLGSCTTTTSYDATANRVSSVAFTSGCGSARTYSYDANGNTSSDTLRSYTHDAADQPVTVTKGSSTTTFTYDGNLKRVKSQTSTNNKVYTVYSHASNLVYRESVSLVASTPTVYLGIGPAELRISGSSVTYTHLDAQGSPVAATGSTGSVAWTEQYTPFGDTLLSPTGNNNNKSFTGYLRDTNIGLDYAEARYYDPVTGRFLEADPMREADQVSLYAYVGNDPVNKTDPTGEVTARNNEPDDGRQCVIDCVDPGHAERTQEEGSRDQGGDMTIGQAVGHHTYAYYRRKMQDCDFNDSRCVYRVIDEMESDGQPLPFADPRKVLSDFASDTIGTAATSAATTLALAKVGAWIAPWAKTALGPSGSILGRAARGGSSLLNINANNSLRFGWGWKGSANTIGGDVIRLSGTMIEDLGVAGGHIDIWSPSEGWFP